MEQNKIFIELCQLKSQKIKLLFWIESYQTNWTIGYIRKLQQILWNVNQTPKICIAGLRHLDFRLPNFFKKNLDFGQK